jgi:PAS domain S-box-containing protein
MTHTTHIDHDRLCRQIVENSQDAMIFADRDGMIRLWNRGAETVFGYGADEVLGQSLDVIIPDRLRDRHWEGYRKVMETGVTKYGKEILAVPAMGKDGNRISVEFTIVLVQDTSGEPAGTAAVIRDVTDRRRRDMELRQRLAELESSCKARQTDP